jgi:hypothetical protein
LRGPPGITQRVGFIHQYRAQTQRDGGRPRPGPLLVHSASSAPPRSIRTRSDLGASAVNADSARSRRLGGASGSRLGSQARRLRGSRKRTPPRPPRLRGSSPPWVDRRPRDAYGSPRRTRLLIVRSAGGFRWLGTTPRS